MLTADEVAAHLGKQPADVLTQSDVRALADWFWSLGYRGGFASAQPLFMEMMSALGVWGGKATIAGVDWPAIVARYKGDLTPNVLDPLQRELLAALLEGAGAVGGSIAGPFLDAAGRALPAAAVLGLVAVLGIMGIRRIL